MENENNKTNAAENDSTFLNDERRGLNENANFENAKNVYQNNEPLQKRAVQVENTISSKEDNGTGEQNDSEKSED